MFVGNKQVMSFGGNQPGSGVGRPVLRPVGGNWTVTGGIDVMIPAEIRSYPDFLI